MNTIEYIAILQAVAHHKLELSATDNSIYVNSKDLTIIMDFLKNKRNFQLLNFLTAVDYPDRFDMVYGLLNMDNAETISLKVKLHKDEPLVPSLSSLWEAANVQEREVYDLMGIVFSGHPHLKRILTDDDFIGHPLRKDYVLNIIDRQSADELQKDIVPPEFTA